MTQCYRRSKAAYRKRIGLYPILSSVGLILSLAASTGTPPPPPANRPPVRFLVVIPPPSKDPTAPFVGVIGDSTGSQLVEPLAAELNQRNVGVVGATTGGCQATSVVLTFESNEYFQRHQNCPKDAVEKQNDMVFRFHPKTVVWADITEWSGIKLKDRIVAAGTQEWKQLMLDAWDGTLGRLGGAHLVLILPTWWAGWPLNTPVAFPVEQQRILFRAWAARHPGRVTVVDVGSVICPAGPPCSQFVNGVQLRTDHVHYTAEGTRRAISKIMTDSPALRTIRGPATLPAAVK